MLGRGTWNRTTILGFGDPYTNRCTMPLYSALLYQILIDNAIVKKKSPSLTEVIEGPFVEKRHNAAS